MIDWQKYGPSYTVSPGIKKIGDLPIIEFDDQEDRYLELKKKTKENIFFDPMFDKDKDQKVVNKVKEILKTAATHIARKKRNSTITLKSPTADLVFGRERI